jgi:hypothetical protein
MVLEHSDFSAGGSGTTWIVKPTSLNRGNGIEVFNTLADITDHLKCKSSGMLQKELAGVRSFGPMICVLHGVYNC